ETYVFKEGDSVVTVTVANNADNYLTPDVTLPDGTQHRVQLMPTAYDSSFDVKMAGRHYTAAVLQEGTQLTILSEGIAETLHYLDPLSFESGDEGAGGGLHAPMPGKVVAVRVQLGDTVK